ncbi:MAG: nucleotide exchange factor GrpE [Alphaproteobacteria bacterium]|nr:nucleotide exchange factor GrpE [Alphaproteobacteria bacterium]
MTDDTQKPDEAEAAKAGEAETEAAGSEAPGAEARESDAEAEAPAAEDEAGKLRDQLLRALAEVENTKKRAARDVKEAREYAVTGFARDMLDVADNLARALGSLDDETKAQAGPALQTLLEGVELTERRLASTLERHGVKPVNPEAGEPLDPNRHQAAAQVPADQPKGTIAHVMQPGYVIGERILRAATVVVSAGPAQGAKPAEAPAADGSEGKPRNGGVDVSA